MTFNVELIIRVGVAVGVETKPPLLVLGEVGVEHLAVEIENDRSVVLGERRIRQWNQYPAEYCNGRRNDGASTNPSGHR